MTSRAIFWTLGSLLGYGFRSATGDPDPLLFFGFWSGMMLAAVFVHFDPPEVERWDKSA